MDLDCSDHVTSHVHGSKIRSSAFHLVESKLITRLFWNCFLPPPEGNLPNTLGVINSSIYSGLAPGLLAGHTIVYQQLFGVYI